MARYLIPAEQRFRVEDSIRKSRFLVTLAHTPDQSFAEAFVSAIRHEFSDATHNCWAWQPGPYGDTSLVLMSDDGEPQGTAGRPMLNILLHSGVGEISAVVTRYFGGQLGSGGLVRAYSSVVALALATFCRYEKKLFLSGSKFG